MRFILQTCLLCFGAILSFNTKSKAQYSPQKQEPVKVTFYYTAVWELTTAENWVYRREAYFDLTDLVFDGVFSDYNKNNELIADGIYNRGVKSGIHSEYANHSVKTKVEYSGNDFTIWEWNDSKGEGVKNGSGKFSTIVFYFVSSDGQIVPKQGVLDGEFQNGRRVGRWLYRDLSNFKTDEETYTNGKLVKHVRFSKQDSTVSMEPKSIYLSLNSFNAEALSFDRNSFSNLNQYFEKYVTYPTSFHRNPTYPKGLRHLFILLANAMMVPERNIEVVRLKINERGLIEKSVIARSINITYDELTSRVLERHLDRFLPAMRNGRPEAAVIYLPIASGEEWMQTLKEAPMDWLLDYTNFY